MPPTTIQVEFSVYDLPEVKAKIEKVMVDHERLQQQLAEARENYLKLYAALAGEPSLSRKTGTLALEVYIILTRDNDATAGD